MKRVLAALSLCAFATSAIAQTGRPALHTMTCTAASSFVSSRGAVVADTSPNAYQRLVASGAYCQHGETAEPYFSRTKDKAQCLVGYECLDISRYDDPK